MNLINNKAIIGLIALFMIFSVFVLFSFITDDSDEKFMQELSRHEKIEEDQIKSFRMSKVILLNSTYKHIEVEISKERIQEIITIINSASSKSIKTVNNINSSISSGIVITLMDKSKIRIQYDKKNIYVTRSEVKHIREERKYIIEDSKLKEVFEDELKKHINI